MKRQFFLVSLFGLIASIVLSETLPSLVWKYQKSSFPVFPSAETEPFRALQKKAVAGDTYASEELYNLVSTHMRAVYRPLEERGGVLLSSRRPLKGFSEPENNYAVNLDQFFEETVDRVRVQKGQFMVKTGDGTEYEVYYPEYNAMKQAITAEKDGISYFVPLSVLRETDRVFVESALMDDLFESRSFRVSVEDERQDKEQTGSRSRIRTETEELNRSLVFENKGDIALKGLIVEYQVFAEQTVLGLPEDFPEDYRCVGFFELDTLAPNETKKITLNLPDIVNQRLQPVNHITLVAKPGRNGFSEGRINGIWVKVHRITPYGEHLMVEHKSSGTPSIKWTTVAPVGADI